MGHDRRHEFLLAVGAGAQVGRGGHDRVAVGLTGQHAWEFVRDVSLAHRCPLAFSSRPASRCRPRAVRVLTVPSGVSSAAEISVCV